MDRRTFVAGTTAPSRHNPAHTCGPRSNTSPSGDNALYPQFAALCRDAGFEPRIEQEANQNGMILALVA